MDLLACPICKCFPLQLIVFEKVGYKREFSGEPPLCELYCGFEGDFIKNLSGFPCRECMKLEVVEGILYCRDCGRWYPVDEEIPRMLPDDLRDLGEDRSFLERFKDAIPEYILMGGRPINLGSRRK
jgi:uncharacterized protein YbaR (Trm112 family)